MLQKYFLEDRMNEGADDDDDADDADDDIVVTGIRERVTTWQ